MANKCRFKIDKLVRDKLQEIMKAKDIKLSQRVMDNEEYIMRLKDKLIEEAHEVISAKNQDELYEELADVLEVIFALCSANNLSMQSLEEARTNKKKAKGGFDQKIYGDFVEMASSNPSIDYFLVKPDQYPKIIE